MFTSERHQVIREIVRKRRRINFGDLQELVKVSAATLRRDLAELELSSDIIRVHGGVLDRSYVRSETTLEERKLKNKQAKKAIAATAAALVPSGASVYVDAGSTCLEAGKLLLARKDLQIITHSVTLVAAGVYGDAEIICVGGQLRKVGAALTGGEALGAVSVIRCDIAFIGASGLDPALGCSTTELSEAGMKKAILAGASRKVLLADRAKWGQTSTIRFAEWQDFTDWVTDTLPPASEVRSLAAAGVKVHQAR